MSNTVSTEATLFSTTHPDVVKRTSISSCLLYTSTASHRSAMLSNMACSLIKHKRITTTVAKAKALKKFVEPLITKDVYKRQLKYSSSRLLPVLVW